MRTKVPELYRLLNEYCTDQRGAVYATCLCGLVRKRMNAYTMIFIHTSNQHSYTSFGFRSRLIDCIYIFYSAVR